MSTKFDPNKPFDSEDPFASIALFRDSVAALAEFTRGEILPFPESLNCQKKCG